MDTDLFTKDLHLYGAAGSQKYSNWVSSFFGNIISGWGDVKTTLVDKITDVDAFPFVKDTFYYDDFKGDIKDVFSHHLKQLGWKDYKVAKTSEELSQMSPEEAFKRVRGISAHLAYQLRDGYFMKRAAWKTRPTTEVQKGTLGNELRKHIIAPMPDLIEGVIQKEMGMDKYRKWIRDNQYSVYLKYNTPAGMSVYQGFLETIPVVKHLVKFDGPYFDRYRKQKGLQALHGLGALTGLITQLLTISKALSPLTMPITQGMATLIKGIPSKTGISKLTHAGVNLVRSIFGSVSELSGMATMGGLRFGINYGTLTALQIGMSNYIQDKPTEAADIDKVINSFALGSSMGGVAGYWRLQVLPWWVRFGGEEITQSAVAATFGLAEMIQDKGHLDAGDFWSSFLWELFEVAPENLIPIILGFGGLGGIANIADVKGLAARGMEYAKDAKKAVVKHTFGLTDAKATEKAVDILSKDVKRLQDGGGKFGPREMSKLIANYREQQLKAASEPGYYDLPMRNKKARELQYYYFVNRPDKLTKRADLSDESVEEYVKWMTAHHNVNWEWLVSTGELPDVVQAVKNELITGQAYIGHFVPEAQISKLKLRLLQRAKMPLTYAKDAAEDIDMETFAKWEGKINKDAVEVAGARLADLDHRVVLLNNKGDPIGTVMGDKLVDGVLRNWIREHWGQEFPPKLLFDDEVRLLEQELDVWDDIATDWGRGRVMDLMNLRKDMRDDMVYKSWSTVADYFAGQPKFMAKYNIFDPYMEMKKARDEKNYKRVQVNNNIKMILNKAPDTFFRHWPVSTVRNNAFKVLTYGLGSGLNAKALVKKFNDVGIDVKLEEIKQVLGEMRAWEGTREKSKYFIEGQKTWPIKEGLRFLFDIPRDLTIKQYIPFQWRIAQLTASRSPKLADLANKYQHNPHEMPRKDMKMPSFKEWMKLPLTGYDGFQLYINRGLRMRFNEGPLLSFARAVDERPLPVSAQRVLKTWISSIKGVPLAEDVMTQNFIVDQIESLTKLPGFNARLDDKTVRSIWDIAQSAVYAGGLGFKFSSAVKNMFQGPMNMPPGMTMYWWMRGLRKVWAPEAREMLIRNGIWSTMGVETITQEATGRVPEVLRHMMYMFTWVDHYLNRGPVYLGARDQMEYYINKFKGIEGNTHPITDGVTRIVQWPSGRPRQWEAIGKRWVRMAKEADAALARFERGGRDMKYIEWKDYADAIVDKMQDEYGFLQQANSNWEYGILGRPHIFGTRPAKMAATFMTWPTWYFGTYLPSLKTFDIPGLLRHVGKGFLLMTFFRKYFSMNVKPWLLLGPAPMRLYGPTIQTFTYALEWLKASEYMHEEWKQESLDNLKRSAKVFVPGYYGVSDMIKCFKEMQQDSPYWDERTGILHYRKNYRKMLSDLMGTTSFYADRDKYLALLKEGRYAAAAQIGERYGMRKVYRTNQGIQMVQPLTGI